MPDRTFRSRVDAWLVALLFGAAATPLVAAGWQVAHGADRGVIVLSAWSAIMVCLCLLLTVPMRYTFRGGTLTIRSGLLHWEVDLATVCRAMPSRNPLAGPAWSLRRVRLEILDGNFILVSPDDRESFMNELAARCPHLARNGAGLEIRPARP